MAGTVVAIYGIFYDLALAKSCVEKLLAENVAAADVVLHDPRGLGLKDLAHDRNDRSGSSTAVVTSSVAIGGALGLAMGAGGAGHPRRGSAFGRRTTAGGAGGVRGGWRDRGLYRRC